MAIDNVLKHGVNNFFILADVLLSRQPFVSYHYQARGLPAALLPAHLLLMHMPALLSPLPWPLPRSSVLPKQP